MPIANWRPDTWCNIGGRWSRKFLKHLLSEGEDSGLKIVGGLEVYPEKNILTNQNHKCVACESRVTHHYL
jgi:hypothetical protein